VLVERAQLFGKATEIVHLQQQALDPDLPQVRLDDAPQLSGSGSALSFDSFSRPSLMLA
jgi:hypothetical protein